MSLNMESTNYKSISPVKPVAPYQGGKSRLAKTLINAIDQVDHTVYCDVFVGMGGIFFRRKSKPKSEVINDYSVDVANLFRILNNHYAAFIDMLKYQLTGRNEFNRLNQTHPDQLTDLQRAARFLYLQRTAFGGKVGERHYGVSADRPARFNLSTLEPDLLDVYHRLSGVVIEQLDWNIFIKKYDRAGTLFYLDPPYFNGEDDYGKHMFDRSQFSIMAKTLKNIKGKFILSINNVPEIRKIFKGFHIHEVQTTYSISKTRATSANELIITNQHIKL